MKKKNKNYKSVGILGGMGHKATIYFYDKLIDSFKDISNENELPHIIINSNPKLPSRTKSYIEDVDISDKLKFEIGKLYKAGADFVVVPCNSAHYFLKDLHSGNKFINMVEETCEYIINENITNVLILGGEIVRESGLYRDFFDKNNINFYILDDIEQGILRNTIDSVKHNTLNKSIINKYNKMLKKYAKNKYIDAILLACTELPIVTDKSIYKRTIVVDTSKILIQAIQSKLTL